MIHKTLNKHVDAGNWLPEKPLNILERHEGENNLVPLWKYYPGEEKLSSMQNGVIKTQINTKHNY